MEIYRTTTNDSTKINALKAAGELFGLNAPAKVAATTVDGKDTNVLRDTVKQLTVDELRVLRHALDRLRQIANDNDGCRN